MYAPFAVCLGELTADDVFVCNYVCVCVCVCVCARAHTHVWTRSPLYLHVCAVSLCIKWVFVNAREHVFILKLMAVRMYVCMYLYACIFICMYVCVCVY